MEEKEGNVVCFSQMVAVGDLNLVKEKPKSDNYSSIVNLHSDTEEAGVGEQRDKRGFVLTESLPKAAKATKRGVEEQNKSKEK